MVYFSGVIFIWQSDIDFEKEYDLWATGIIRIICINVGPINKIIYKMYIFRLY